MYISFGIYKTGEGQHISYGMQPELTITLATTCPSILTTKLGTAYPVNRINSVESGNLSLKTSRRIHTKCIWYMIHSYNCKRC